MTQRNIDAMDIIVDKMADGERLSSAMKFVYTKRSVAIPFHNEMFDAPLDVLVVSKRTANAMKRAKMNTLHDVLNMCDDNQFSKIKNFGRLSQIELFEAILDYCWSKMSEDEKTVFLIDAVERNQSYIREDIV